MSARRVGHVLLFVAGLLTAAPVTVNGQVEVGDSVRVRLPGALRVAGSLTAWRGDTLMLNIMGLDEPWPVAYGDLQTLERFIDRTPSGGFRRGLGIGLATGVFGGAAIGVALFAVGATDGDGAPGEHLMRSTLKYAGLGAVGGAFIGGFVGGRSPGRGWVSVELRGGG